VYVCGNGYNTPNNQLTFAALHHHELPAVDLQRRQAGDRWAPFYLIILVILMLLLRFNFFCDVFNLEVQNEESVFF
jgi:hypothetical protein